MIREALDPWNYVVAAYVVGIAGTALVIGWSLIGMRRAERRRDDIREKGRQG